MITLEDYTLSYNTYLANEEYKKRSDRLEIRSLSESSVILEADIKDMLKKYTAKIIAGIQKAWDKFKDNVNKAKLDWSDKDITDAINNANIDVTVQDYAAYNPDVITNIKIQTLDYNTMKPYLKDQETFMKQYYSSFYTDPKLSIAENLRNHCITKREDTHKITKDELQSMYDYMKSNKDLLDKMGANLDSINKAAQNVDYIAQMVSAGAPAEGSPTTASTAGGAKATAESYGYFSEADDTPTNTIVKNDDNNGGGGNGGDTEKANTAQKDVQVYFKCTSELLSAMMKISRDIYHFYNSVVSTHMRNVTAAKKQAKKEENNVEPAAATATGTPQINK